MIDLRWFAIFDRFVSKLIVQYACMYKIVRIIESLNLILHFLSNSARANSTPEVAGDYTCIYVQMTDDVLFSFWSDLLLCCSLVATGAFMQASETVHSLLILMLSAYRLYGFVEIPTVGHT